MSQDIRWGIKRGLQKGTFGYAKFVCFGYKRGDDGVLAIDEPDAEIVRKIFRMRADGQSLEKISNWLCEGKIPSPTGKARWSWETIHSVSCPCFRIALPFVQLLFFKQGLEGKR